MLPKPPVIPAFPLLHWSNLEAKLGGVWLAALGLGAVLVIVQPYVRRTSTTPLARIVRFRMSRFNYAAWTNAGPQLALTMLAVAATSAVLYWAANGPAWLQFVVALVAASLFFHSCRRAVPYVSMLVLWLRQRMRVRLVALKIAQCIVAALSAVVLCTAAMWFGLQDIEGPRLFMDVLFDIDSYALWLLTVVVAVYVSLSVRIALMKRHS